MSSLPVLPASASSIDPTLTAAGLPAVDTANEPASIRNGTPAAQQAYGTALSFEEMLVDQLTQEMASTSSMVDDSSDDDSSDDSGDSSSGLLGSDPASSVYSSMIPQVLSSSIMSSGGLNELTMQLATAIDPSIALQGDSSKQAGSSGDGGSSTETAPTQANPSGGAGL